MQTILNFDLGTFRFVEKYLMNPVTDRLFTFITHLGDGGWLWICITLIMLLFPKTRRCGIAVGIALLCSEFIGNQFLKHLIARSRPFRRATRPRRWDRPWRCFSAGRINTAGRRWCWPY